MSLLVVHLALTPLAGSPIRIVDALNVHTDVRARLVVLNPNVYGNRTFAGDLDWDSNKEEAVELLRKSDIVHMHHFFELDRNPFGIRLSRECSRARFIRQFHTHPLTIARGDVGLAARIVNSEIPQLVIAQYHERLYPRARLVPNIVPLANELYKPLPRNGFEPRLFFAPTVDNSARNIKDNASRWETKGAPETEALLNKVVESCGIGRVIVRRNIPHEQCLREKQTSDIAIDELITGSYHLSSLESLSQGLPTFAYLDSRTLDTLAKLTETHNRPWLNFRLEEAEKPLCELINDAKLRLELGAYSREWMETYYNDSKMVGHYVRAYKDLMERPETFQKLRFDPDSRRQLFLAQRADDLIWESRKSRFVAAWNDSRGTLQGLAGVKVGRAGPMPNWIKAPVHDLLKKYTSVRVAEIQALQNRLKQTERILEFVAADEANRWLYHNRLERMDATLDIFNQQRREFHLDRYRFAATRVKGKRVLDCACGTGYGVRVLRELGGAGYVIGVDIEARAVEYASKNHRSGSAEFICSSGDCLALSDASVDVITSFETMEHVPDDSSLLEEFYRVLRPGGALIISTPNQWPIVDAPYHVREYDRAAFLKVLEPRFECVELYNQNSGSESSHNRKQARGIVPTTLKNEDLAECYLAICHCKPQSGGSAKS
jgi:ubiquinone/menaquinone biosynthesis C-methylase UbiE